MAEKREVTSNNEVIAHPNIPTDLGMDGSRKEAASPGAGKSHLQVRMLKSLYYQFYRIHAFLFLFSLGVSVISQLFHVYLPVIQEFAAGFLTFWMPGFCVMFLLWDSAAFKTIFLLPLTLAFSQVVVITEGLLCATLGILWTPLSVLTTTSAFIVASYCVAWRFKRFRLKQPLHLKKCGNFEEFSARFAAGKIIPKNFGYLFVVILLLGIYAVVSFPVLEDDDPWLHAWVVRFAIETGVIHFDLYRVMGLHIYASGFGILAGWDALTVARWFPVFLVINGDLAFYLIMRRLFKNPQIANLGTFFISFTPLLYYYGVNSLWPNALAQPFGLYLLFFLFDALLRKNPTSRAQKMTYIFIVLYFSIILRLIHGEMFVNYWLSTLFLLIFYRKNRKSQVTNIIILLIAVGLFFLIDMFYPTFLLMNTDILFAFPPWLWVLIIPGFILGYKILKKLTTFPPGNFELFTTGKAPDGQFFYKCEIKILKYYIMAGLPVMIALVGFTYDFLPYSTIILDGLTAFITFVELTAAVLGGFIIRRQEHRGKLMFFWSLFFLLGLGGYFAYDLLIAKIGLTMRMLVFASPGLMLLAMGYISYFLKAGNLNVKKSRRIVAVFAISAVIICSLNLPYSFGALKHHEISSADALGSGIMENSTIITGFDLAYALKYFSYEKQIFVDYPEVNELFPEDGDLNEAFFYSLRNGMPEKQIFAIINSVYLSLPIRQVVGENIGPVEMSQVTLYENVTFLHHVHSYGTTNGDWLMAFCLV